MTDENQPSFWSQLWGRTLEILRWVGVKLLAPGAALLIVLLAVVLVAMGWKELQIGGLLSRLLGRKDPEQKAIDIANSVPKDRVGPDGKVIPPGQPDSKGSTQAIVVPIEDPGLFSNPDTIRYVPPGETKPVEVLLPDGVKAKDVEKVIVVQPNVVVVSVKDDSNIPAKKIDDLLSKYGG
jgi:hypothetical protein